jgi:hypothetical protein
MKSAHTPLERGVTYDVGDIMGHDEIAVRTCTFGMDDSFRNPLAVEVCEKVKEMEVLQEEWPILSHTIRCFGIIDRAAIRGCIDGHSERRRRTP